MKKILNCQGYETLRDPTSLETIWAGICVSFLLEIIQIVVETNLNSTGRVLNFPGHMQTFNLNPNKKFRILCKDFQSTFTIFSIKKFMKVGPLTNIIHSHLTATLSIL